jgi:multisubunit Na+/H+ antiporter MnhC subunit
MLSWMQTAYTPLHVVLCSELPLGNEMLSKVLKFSILEHQLTFFIVVIGKMIENFMGISNSK